MAARSTQARIKNALRKMANENPGVTYIALYASNGEVSIVPESAVEYIHSTENTNHSALSVKTQYRDMVSYVMSVLRRKYVSKQEHEFKLAESRLMTHIVVVERDGKQFASLVVPEAGLRLERLVS